MPLKSKTSITCLCYRKEIQIAIQFTIAFIEKLDKMLHNKDERVIK